MVGGHTKQKIRYDPLGRKRTVSVSPIKTANQKGLFGGIEFFLAKCLVRMTGLVRTLRLRGVRVHTRSKSKERDQYQRKSDDFSYQHLHVDTRR